MFKKIIFTILFVTTSSYAQYTTLNKPVFCSNLETIIKDITKDPHKEDLYWTGDDSNTDSKYVFFTNLKTGSWTMIQYNNKMACVIGVGTAGKTQSGNIDFQ